jgi:hypothetical protein
MISYMWDMSSRRVRRSHARIPVETLCSEVVADRERSALVLDLSEEGLCVERPLSGTIPRQIVQLELEIPGVDDVVWASGRVCFDRLWPRRGGPASRSQPVRVTGIRLVAAAERHLRLLREYVVETRKVLEREGLPLDRRRLGAERGSDEGGGWLLRTTAMQRG